MQTMCGATLSDAHADELRLATEAAAAWRAKFHKSKAFAFNDTAPQTPTTAASEIFSASTCASSGNSELDTSEAATEVPSLSPAVPPERSAATTWAFVILISEISLYLTDGLRAPLPLKTAGRQHRVRLYTGPWGRTGLCKHAGSVLVLVDAAAALSAGTKVTRSKGSVVLSPGSSIPSSAFRKMIRITNGATLYEHSTLPVRSSARGPDLPRTRISEAPVSGEVVSWKGQVGWIQPAVPLCHAKASRHRGHLYIHERDVLEGRPLCPGQLVRFHIYEDRSGLGAELCQVKPVPKPRGFAARQGGSAACRVAAPDTSWFYERFNPKLPEEVPVMLEDVREHLENDKSECKQGSATRNALIGLEDKPVVHERCSLEQRLRKMREKVDWSSMEGPMLLNCASYEEWKSSSLAVSLKEL